MTRKAIIVIVFWISPYIHFCKESKNKYYTPIMPRSIPIKGIKETDAIHVRLSPIYLISYITCTEETISPQYIYKPHYNSDEEWTKYRQNMFLHTLCFMLSVPKMNSGFIVKEAWDY